MSSSRYFTDALIADLSTLDASGANSVQFNPGQTIRAKRLIFVTTVAHTVADATITVVRRNRDDTPTETLGTFTLPFTGSATDKVYYVELGLAPTTGTTGVDGSTVYKGYNDGGASIATGQVVNSDVESLPQFVPGEELVMTSNGGGDAGTYHVYVEYIPEGFNPEVLGITANERTFTAS